MVDLTACVTRPRRIGPISSIYVTRSPAFSRTSEVCLIATRQKNARRVQQQRLLTGGQDPTSPLTAMRNHQRSKQRSTLEAPSGYELESLHVSVPTGLTLNYVSNLTIAPASSLTTHTTTLSGGPK
jgi:hypothetical protein